MSSPNDKVSRGGIVLTRRVWGLVAHVGHKVGKPLTVVQGGFRAGHGASASAGTHDKGDVYDISIRNLTYAERLEAVEEFRAWYGDAWLRDPAHGWPASAGGPHIHVVQADSYYALAPGAQQQVRAYNLGANGLRSNARDPFARPHTRRHFVLGAPTPTPTPKPRPKVALANLHYGARNDDVRDLQRALNAHFGGPDLPVTGFYGDQTDAAVRRDQSAHDLGSDAPKHSSVGPRQAAHLGLVVA
jgi:hypothetical protein